MPAGLFGKYPGKRDFLALNLPKGVAGVIDPWLQKAVAISRERLGRQWTEYYVIHPIWNFRLGAEIAGCDCVGALMPSVDGIGRYFPLCILSHAAPGAGFVGFGDIPAAWIEALHGRLLSALDEDEVPQPEALFQGLDDPPQPAADPEAEPLPGGYRMPTTELDQSLVTARFQALERCAADRARSLFWTAGGQFVSPQILSFAGMPDPGVYTGMMADSAVSDDRPP